jgi:hypothetical protein
MVMFSKRSEFCKLGVWLNTLKKATYPKKSAGTVVSVLPGEKSGLEIGKPSATAQNAANAKRKRRVLANPEHLKPLSLSPAILSER